jgi:hypothetical protein
LKGESTDEDEKENEGESKEELNDN